MASTSPGFDPLAGNEPVPNPLAGYAPQPLILPQRQRLEPGGFKALAERRALERAYKSERYPPKPPPLALTKSAAPRSNPKEHTPPLVAELRDLIRLYQRRRDEIAQDQSLAYEASLQALSNVVHAYQARYRCATAEAAAVLRPLRIGAMG